MQLTIDSDASYLSETKARAGGVHYLKPNPDDTNPQSMIIDALSSIIPNVVSSACEAEYAAMFMNGVNGCSLRQTLTDIGYPQQTTKLTCDNTAAVSIVNGNPRARKSKAMDMKWHRMQDKQRQGIFNVVWEPGPDNKADYYTKVLPTSVFAHQRQTYVTTPLNNHPKAV